MLAGDSMSSRFFYKLGATQLYRRSMCGGVRSEAWAGTYGAVPGCPPEFAAAGEAERGVGQQRDRHQPASGAPHPPVEAQRRAGWWWSIRCAPRSPSRPTCIWRRCPARTCCWRGRWRRNWNGWARSTMRSSRGTCWASTSSWRQARAWPVARAAAACGLREEADRHLRAVAGRGRSAGVRAGQRAGARAQRRQRDPCADRAAGAAGQAGQGQRHRPRRQQRVSQDDGAAAAAGPGAAGHAHAEPARCRAASGRRRHRSAAARGVHLQPQSDRRASRSEPHAPRPGARGRVRGRHRCGDDREHGVLRHRAAGGDAFRIRRSVSVVWPSLAAARRGGDPAGGRVVAEHRDLPASGGAVRVR